MWVFLWGKHRGHAWLGCPIPSHYRSKRLKYVVLKPKKKKTLILCLQNTTEPLATYCTCDKEISYTLLFSEVVYMPKFSYTPEGTEVTGTLHLFGLFGQDGCGYNYFDAILSCTSAETWTSRWRKKGSV